MLGGQKSAPTSASVLLDADAEATRAFGPVESATLLRSYGIDVVPFAEVSTMHEAAAAAERFGFPVAVMATSATWRGRLDREGARLLQRVHRLPVGSELEVRHQRPMRAQLDVLAYLEPPHRARPHPTQSHNKVRYNLGRAERAYIDT